MTRYKSKSVHWGPAFDSLLGTMPDVQAALEIGCSAAAAKIRRNTLRIPAYRPPLPENYLVLCACGCGQTFLRYNAHGRARQYLPSHWSNVQPNQRETVVCETCGKPYRKAQWHMKRVNHHFCSQECCGKWAAKNGTRKGKSNGHYHTITVPCAGCGAPVSRAYSLVMRRNNRVYCETCIPVKVRHGRRGFYVGYPHSFSPALRTRIRKRDNYTCQICGRTQAETGTLHVHHIDYDKEHNDPMNLVAVCVTCHGTTNFACDEWTAKLQALMRTRFGPHQVLPLR